MSGRNLTRQQSLPKGANDRPRFETAGLRSPGAVGFACRSQQPVFFAPPQAVFHLFLFDQNITFPKHHGEPPFGYSFLSHEFSIASHEGRCRPAEVRTEGCFWLADQSQG